MIAMVLTILIQLMPVLNSASFAAEGWFFIYKQNDEIRMKEIFTENE